LQWSSNRYPFLGFVPVTPEFSGPLLGRLAYDFRTLPIAQADGLFFLDPVLRERWLRLEVGLYSTAWRLYDLIPGRGPFTSYFAFYPRPSEFGFTRMHKSERIARKCTMISRDAFVPLMAMVSHAIAKQYDREPDRTGSISLDSAGQTVRWMRILTAFGVPRQWVELLGESWIPDWSVPRVGLIVNPYTWKSLNEIPFFVYAGVPVWIYWDQRKARDPRVADEYRLTLEQKENAIK